MCLIKGRIISLDLLVTFFLIQSRTLFALCTDGSLSRAGPPRLPELPPQSCLPTTQYPACTAAWVYFFPGSLLPQVSGAWDSYRQILPLKTEVKKTLSTLSSTSFITRATALFSHGPWSSFCCWCTCGVLFCCHSDSTLDGLWLSYPQICMLRQYLSFPPESLDYLSWIQLRNLWQLFSHGK